MTTTTTLTVDNEECLLRGYIPLQNLNIACHDDIEEITFEGNGYLTDAVLHLLRNHCEKKRDAFSKLTKVNLLGCSLITDHGVRALIQGFNGLDNISEINFGGCELLTDSAFAMINKWKGKISNQLRCNMTGTAVSHHVGVYHGIDTTGCPKLIPDEDYNGGQVLIVPHPHLTTSMGEYLYSEKVVSKNEGFHKKDLKTNDWTISLTEINPSSCLLDNMVSGGCSQVMIPFDASSEPKDVAKHVLTTICRVVAKEPIWQKLDETVSNFTPTQSKRPFMDVLKISGLEIFEEDGSMKLKNRSLSESVIGMFASRERFTRSNSYIEVTVRSEGSDGKAGCLIGCLYDVLYDDRNPMDSTSDVGGMVDGFEIGTEEKTIGFGIEGEWLSEYVPRPDADFYFIENGEKCSAKTQNEKLTPNGSMYPILSVLGERTCIVTLPPLVEPPKELQAKLEKENKWIEKGYSQDCLIDKQGRLTYCGNYTSTKGHGLFLGRQELKANQSYTFSVVVEDFSSMHANTTDSDFSIGLAGEFLKTLEQTGPKNMAHTMSFHVNKSETVEDTKKLMIAELSTHLAEGRAKYGEENIACITIDTDDVITVSCKVLSVKQSETEVEMIYYLRESVLRSVTVTFTHTHAETRIVPVIALKHPGDVLRLNNFKPTYRKPAPYRDKITLGRCHYLNVMDNGDCHYKLPQAFPAASRDYGWFMSKVPFNKDMLSFTVEIKELDSMKLFGIGVTEPDFVQKSSFLGWKQDQVGYHADNGKVYCNDGTGSNNGFKGGPIDAKMTSGDVVMVTVAAWNTDTPLEFDEDGDLKPQRLKLLFYKNNELMYEIEHKFAGEGIYPAFSTKNSTVRIHNFYPETAELWEKLSKTKEEKVVEPEETTTGYQGTEFLVVGVTNNSSDPSGKLQLLQQELEQLTPSNFQAMTNLATAISDMEKDLSVLDLQEQRRYGELCSVRDNLTQFVEQVKHRVKYLGIDCSSNSGKLKEGRDKILRAIEMTEEKLKMLQPIRYKTHQLKRGKGEDSLKMDDMILKHLSSVGVFHFSNIFDQLPELTSTDGRTVMALLKLMQSRGQLLLLDFGSDTVIADIEYILKLEGNLWQLLPADLIKTGTTVTCIGETSHVWENSDKLEKIMGEIPGNQGEDNTEKRKLLKLILEKCLGLIEVPCLRTQSEQEKCVYVIQQNVTSPAQPLSDYWSPGKDQTNYVVMKQVYTFPLGLPEHVLPIIISNTTKYGQMILMTGEGVVYQNGAVQTVIIKHQSAENNVIILESRCYMPDLQNLDDCKLSKLTPSYVKDYTWNIFCIFTDIIDDLLQRSNIVTMVIKDFPKDLVNVSVGCKHLWMKNTNCSVVQSVCTMCNSCCGGDSCSWNGIMGEYFRQSGCCSEISGCQSCGICIPCAQELWSIRSRLRPHGNTITEVEKSIKEKTKKITAEEQEAKTRGHIDLLKESIVPLDPYIYNEVEFINLSVDPKMICLREESDGSVLKVFPGPAASVKDLQSIPLTPKESGLALRNGDQVTLRLTDPRGVALLASEDSKRTENSLQVEPQYFASVGREVKVEHETGIVMYDTVSTAIPVGQLIAVRPMTKEYDHFSIRILSTGEKGTIAMGVGPVNYGFNRQPGWNAQSIGFHADDGGIFLESGWPTRKTQSCKVGDIMSFFVDFSRNKGFFRKNGEKMIELNLNFNKLACYPMIGLHSPGEAVEILEKEFWTPKTEEERTKTPPAFATYKYGNLWISPGDTVTFSKLNNLRGWVVLHNPTKDPVGFKVRCDGANDIQFFGTIDHKKTWLKELKIPADTSVNAVVIEWVSLESGRRYSEDDIKLMFGESQNHSSHQHRLNVQITDTKDSLEELELVSSGPPKNNKSLLLQVFRNMKCVNEYWFKYGNYHVSVEADTKAAKFLLKYPKCPGFTYARGFQKGMKFVIYLESEKAYAECVVVEVYPGGKSLALEYSPKDRTSNMTVCIMTSSSAFNFSDFDKDNSYILPYETRNTPSNLTRTFVNAPPYLLSEGAKKTLPFLYPEWKANMLKSMANCSQVFTRLTIQEHHIWNAAKNLMDWYPEGYDGHLYTFLPSQLTQSKLVYPQPEQLFSDISVHRLCFAQNELILSASYYEQTVFEMPLKLAIHYADIPGIPPENPLSVDMMFGEGLNVWAYVALIYTRLYLPSYKKMIPDHSGKFTREQVEQLLYKTLQTYASLCGIYAASFGGIEYVQMNEVRDVKRAIRHEDKYLQHLTQDPLLDPHALIQKGDFAVCKAHLMNYGIVDKSFFKNEVEFKYEFFEPYNDHVTIFYWGQEELQSLPDDFFSRFPNLVHFQLGVYGKSMDKFKKLPEGIGNADRLRCVEIRDMALESLPEDIFLGKHLESLQCTNLPVRHLPSKWPSDSQLELLGLCGLLIKEVPEEIGKLTELRDLDLCRNPITDLPESLANLNKLTVLSVRGCPLLALEGKRSQIRPNHTNLFIQNSVIKYDLGYDTVEKLFAKYDTNNNGSLDEEEIAVLNMDMFYQVPRLGITDINDEVTGGIPPVIFKLKYLEELHLEHNAITMVPQAINNLQNLKVLNLCHNPLLESLPGSLGHLPNISKIHITSCPMLRTPPIEVVGRGFDSVKAYLKRLAGGFTECRRTKLMVVGLGGAGKTSLLRALMSEKKQTQGTEKEIPTDGIDIVPWTVRSKDGEEITYSTWDFAGQAVYYNTHQFFLSKRAVYLLLWSMRQGYEHAGLDFWLSSICCHAPGTPIIVVGTQCDLIPKAEIPEKELLERYPQIASFHRVSAIEGTGIAELQDSLLDVTLQQGYMGEKIPQVWLNFERRIIAERLTKKSYIKWDVARQYAMEQGIYDEKDVRMAVQLLHDLGTIQYFDNDFLRDYVVINPQWIVNVMACVVSAQDSPIQKNHGRFLHSDITTVWKDYDSDLHQWLLRLTEDFDLTFPLPKEPVNIVPCLLPGEPPNDLKWPSVRDQEGIRETKMVYRFTYLPSGLFNRAQVRLFQFSNGKMVWKKGSLLSKNKHLALIKQTDNKELVVYVQGPRPENILFLIHEVFESIIEESFNGVFYDLFLPCPDCVTKEGTAEPDLLNAKLIQRAKDLKAPFIQCYKYFHWISMAQLQEKMPADSKEVADFDIQLQQSVVALQELNNDLVVDTAILYSMADIPGPDETNKIAPTQIRDDIKSWGYSCWFSEDMEKESVVDVAAAVKNCKILIALVSDDFERDSKCRDMLLYAKETMNKDIIIVVLRESLEWENKDLGMKIGRQERKLMAKTKARYENEGGRRDELNEWLTEKMQMLTQEIILPDVFLSYCWSNSQNAAEKSGRINPDALGWGDPRQLKGVLQENGISCWIDTDYVGKDKKGIFADMAAGISNSKVFLAFISDEYAESDNCMMELRFGTINNELPLIAAIVGTKSDWKYTEVAMLLRRAQANEVSLQKENPEGVKVMVQFVQDALQKAKLAGPKSKKKTNAIDLLKQGNKLKSESKSTSIAYQEEVELIQRKFMRHILGSILAGDTMPLPRLMVVDFVKGVKQQKTDEGRDSSLQMASKSRKKLRPKTATKSRDRLQVDEDILNEEEDDWTKESLCIRVLCEHEGGWHVCEEMYPLAFRTRDNMEHFMMKASPYLYRIYTVLKQGPIKLKCCTTGKGEAFQKWIRQESEENLDFIGSMMHLRSHLATDDAADFVSCLARCRLPSGKILWLCKKHQQEEHVAKLSTGSRGSSYNVTKVLFNEDKFLLEHMEKSDVYKKLKAIKSKKVAPNLPKPIPIPDFIPIPAPSAPEQDKKSEQPKAEGSQKNPENTKTDPTTNDKEIKEDTAKKAVPKEPLNDEKIDRQANPDTKAKNQEDLTSKNLKVLSSEPNLNPENTDKANIEEEVMKVHANSDVNKQENEKDVSDGKTSETGKVETLGKSCKQVASDPNEVENEVKLEERNMKPKRTEEENIDLKQTEETMAVNSVKPKRKESSKEITEAEKDKIKSMILQSDTKALKKAMRKPVSKAVSHQGFSVQPSGMKTLQQRQSANNFSNVIRGSNVKRVYASTDPADLSSSRTSSQSSQPELEMSLHIQTVNKNESGVSLDSVSQPGKSKSSIGSKSADSSKADTFPLDKVRPKKIHVQPKRRTSETTGNRQNLTATGIGVGVTKGAEMPLPERTDSKACVLQ